MPNWNPSIRVDRWWGGGIWRTMLMAHRHRHIIACIFHIQFRSNHSDFSHVNWIFFKLDVRFWSKTRARISLTNCTVYNADTHQWRCLSICNMNIIFGIWNAERKCGQNAANREKRYTDPSCSRTLNEWSEWKKKCISPHNIICAYKLLTNVFFSLPILRSAFAHRWWDWWWQRLCSNMRCARAR